VRNRSNTILVVDAISGLLGDDMKTDEWGVDICVSGSQKGFMLPPGLGFASVSNKAWRFCEASNMPKYYFDFVKQKKALEKKSPTPFTPGVSLVVALNRVLAMVDEDGIDEFIKKTAICADATRKAVAALGLGLFSRNPANTLTAIKVPEGVDGGTLKTTLSQKYGIQVAGGQAQLKGKIIRITHVGYIDKFDTIIGISSLEFALKDLGYSVEFGRGVRAAEEAFSRR